MIHACIAAAASLCSVGQSVTTKRYSHFYGSENILSFNLIKSAAALLIFLALSLFDFEMHLPTLLFSAVYAVSLLISMLAGYQALSKGPMALTSLIASYSLIIPCIFGAVCLHERIGFFHLCGIALLLLSMFCIMYKKEQNCPFQKNWGLYCAVTFLSNGICSVTQKLHQVNYPGKYLNTFTVFSFAVIFIAFLILSLFKQKGIKKEFKYAPASGVCMGLGSYLTLMLSAELGASVLFPILSAVTMLLNYITAKLLFKETFSKIQLCGFILGIVSVIIIKIS